MEPVYGINLYFPFKYLCYDISILKHMYILLISTHTNVLGQLYNWLSQILHVSEIDRV